MAINTSGFSGAIAVASINEPNRGQNSQTDSLDGRFSRQIQWFEKALTQEEKTAQHLVPAIKELLISAGIDQKDIHRIGVATGPGSFTGLRIGITTAKTLAYALNAEVVGINSLAAVAKVASLSGYWTSNEVTVLINAYRQQLFHASFDQKKPDDPFKDANSKTSVTNVETLIPFLLESESLVIGPGLTALPETTREKIKQRMIEQEFNNTAIGVGELSSIAKTTESPISLLPNYFRGSAAEENPKFRKNQG